MTSLPPAESLRILCLDGGGIKGYTSLLILQRILRIVASVGELSKVPQPWELFDLIVGTSTGGLIAIMLGRLHMDIEACIHQYERVGWAAFSEKPLGGQMGRIFSGMTSCPFYDVEVLQGAVKRVLGDFDLPSDTPFCELEAAPCRVYIITGHQKRLLGLHNNIVLV